MVDLPDRDDAGCEFPDGDRRIAPGRGACRKVRREKMACGGAVCILHLLHARDPTEGVLALHTLLFSPEVLCYPGDAGARGALASPSHRYRRTLSGPSQPWWRLHSRLLRPIPDIHRNLSDILYRADSAPVRSENRIAHIAVGGVDVPQTTSEFKGWVLINRIDDH